ncbi:penicillin-binding protein activator [Palleronia sp.]|uniref:penicillin-binding protein activator n=1 Tax=Palleronia sp. TaxID=1940284 RepID=UPI0035C7A6F9
MFAFLSDLRKRAAVGLVLALTGLAGCAGLPVAGPGAGGDGPRVDTSAPVPVALLLPRGGSGGDASVSASMENAARLAMASAPGAQIDLRVYDTGGSPAGASAAATTAVNEGAQIILGPLYSQSISAVTPVVSGQNINVLSFSNNTAVAGGNVFVLGQTFVDVAERLTSFARQQGRPSVAIVHAEGVAGEAGRDAILQAAQSAGMEVATVQSYPLSQQGITQAAPRIARAVNESGATAMFLTANVDADLPLLATALPENGISPAQVQYLGLTRWSAAPEALSLPGLQGGLFALPDNSALERFNAQYRAAYGSAPHPLAGVAYDGMRAVSTLLAEGRSDALSQRALTRRDGFEGAYGAFRLLPNGTNDRALAVATIRNNEVVILDPAPSSTGRAGF